MDENRCVCCGCIIPEGRMVCPACEMGLTPDKRTSEMNLEELDEKLPDRWRD